MEIKDRQGNIILSDKGQDNMLERCLLYTSDAADE